MKSGEQSRSMGAWFAGLLWVTLNILLGLTIWWPDWVAKRFHSRWALAYFAVWCLVAGVWFHKQLRAGMAQGIREFQKATDQVIKEILDAFFGKWW